MIPDRPLSTITSVQIQDDVTDAVLDWLSDATDFLISLAVIIVVAFIAMRLLRILVQRVIQRVMASREGSSRELRQRAETLGSIIESTGRFFIIFIAALTILTNIGISLGPLIASAGIAGLAIAFGAQTLISDTFNGFFILLEGQFAIGDYVTVGSVGGTVEAFSLRRTVLRSADGAAVTVPNSEIRIVSNLSKGWSRATVDIAVAPNANGADVLRIFQDVLDEAMEDPDLKDKILEPPTMLGLNTVEANQITFRALVNTKPLEQWGVERELTRRVRERLLAADIPLPPRTIDIITGA